VAQAKSTKDHVPGWTEKKDGIKAQREKRAQLKSETFEKLTKKQKDLLLKRIAVRLGMIADSEDEG
jgi:hypothetical protein